MATAKKTAPKKALKAQPEIAEKNAYKVMEGSVLTGQPLVVPAEEPKTEPPENEAPAQETPTETIPDLAETRKTPEQIALEDYGVDSNCFNTTVIMRSVLFEMVRIRSVLEGAASVRK